MRMCYFDKQEIFISAQANIIMDIIYIAYSNKINFSFSNELKIVGNKFFSL